MPVTNNYEIQEYQGNSSGRTFNFPFRCFSLDHLKVELIDSEGNASELVQNTDYKVTGGIDNSGGMITYPLDASLPALSASETIRIYRSTPMEQSIDYPTYQQAIENALDKVTMLLQEAVNDSAVNIANEAIEKVNKVLALSTSKANVDGSNIDKYPFLTALGIGSNGELDLTDFCKTDGSNANAEAFQSLVGMPEVESDIAELSVSTAKTDGSNITVEEWRILLGIKDGVTAGTVAYYCAESPPDGWLVANGAEISRTDYSDLFTVIGTTFGEGDGTTTFNIPDLRGVFLRGVDNGRGIDTDRALGSYQEDDNKSHSHAIRVYSAGGSSVYNIQANHQGSLFGTPSSDPSGGIEARPKNVVLLPCIKY